MLNRKLSLIATNSQKSVKGLDLGVLIIYSMQQCTERIESSLNGYTATRIL